MQNTDVCGCVYGSYKHDTEKELEIINENQRRYVINLFKESYDVLGIDTEKYNK